MKVTVLSADGGTMNWVNVGINEISVYSAPKETVLDTADTNHMLGATMTASSNETATLTPTRRSTRTAPAATIVGPAATRLRATSG